MEYQRLNQRLNMAPQNNQSSEGKLLGIMKDFGDKILFFSLVAVGMMASSLWSPPDTMGKKLPPILVTKEVLVEYVEDRLIQLERKENLTEEEVVELNFIRQNRTNFQKLAEFYGMEIEEARPEKRPSQEESPIRVTVEKSSKTTSQSDPTPADASQLRKEEAVIGATSIQLPEIRETFAEVKPVAKMTEHERPKRAEENTAKKSTKQGVTSPEEISSIHRSSETSIAASNSTSQAYLPIYLNDPPSSLGITKEEVNQLLTNYVEYYTKRDIDRFLSLFSPNATQNWTKGFDRIQKIYSEFFDQSRDVLYHLEGTTIRFYQNAVEAKSRYRIYQVLQDGKTNVWEGRVRWILERENEDLKIRYLDYKQEKFPHERKRRPTEHGTRAERDR